MRRLLYSIPADKTEVVYHGIDFNPNQIAPKIKQKLPNSYILYVGKRARYKNFSLLLHAFPKLTKKHCELHLVCVGDAAFNDEEKSLISNLNITDRCHHLSTDDIGLKTLYYNAKCFVFPSLYEGFGMPILEAFSQRCPVVLSNSSCFPEIAQDAAFYFDPYSVESCIETVDKALSEDTRKMVLRGILLCEQFSWKSSAQKLAKIYHRVFDKK